MPPPKICRLAYAPYTLLAIMCRHVLLWEGFGAARGKEVRRHVPQDVGRFDDGRAHDGSAGSSGTRPGPTGGARTSHRGVRGGGGRTYRSRMSEADTAGTVNIAS